MCVKIYIFMMEKIFFVNILSIIQIMIEKHIVFFNVATSSLQNDENFFLEIFEISTVIGILPFL